MIKNRKVKILEGPEISILENEINDFINDKILIDIKFNTNHTNSGWCRKYVMIIYEDKE